MATANTLVLYPVLLRSHIVSMLELGKLIITHHPEFSITVIIPPHHTTTDNLPTAYPSNINFHYLPAEPPVKPPATLSSACRLRKVSLHSALSSISKATNIRAFIIDFFNSPALEVADALNIPTYYYFSSGAVVVSMFLYLPTLSKTIIPDSLKDLRRHILNVPGMPPLFASDMLDGLYRTSPHYQDNLKVSATMVKSSGIIINTFESFESRVLAAIRNGLCNHDSSTPPIFPIGPVVETKVKADLMEERHESLHWLDLQPSRSVIFLCFGSLGAFSRAQLNEMALGLEKSGVRFLWVVRGLPIEDKTGMAFAVDETVSLDSILPEGFLERTRDRGLVVKSWVPQTDVLHHDSLGGFMSHCGWNSILEAVSANVPMVAWPLYAEHKVNCTFLVDEVKIAIRLIESDEGFVSADELESRVVELMSSEIGEELRKKGTAMRDAMVAAKSAIGTSRKNLTMLIETFKQI